MLGPRPCHGLYRDPYFSGMYIQAYHIRTAEYPLRYWGRLQTIRWPIVRWVIQGEWFSLVSHWHTPTTTLKARRVAAKPFSYKSSSQRGPLHTFNLNDRASSWMFVNLYLLQVVKVRQSWLVLCWIVVMGVTDGSVIFSTYDTHYYENTIYKIAWQYCEQFLDSTSLISWNYLSYHFTIVTVKEGCLRI